MIASAEEVLTLSDHSVTSRSEEASFLSDMYPVYPIFPRFSFAQIFQDALTVQHGAQFCFLRALSPEWQHWLSGRVLLGGTYHDSSASFTLDNLTSFLHLTANLLKKNLAEYDQNYLNFYDWLVDRQYDGKTIFPL